MNCPHDDVVCLNEYEFIRKYRCSDCGAIAMCACDEEFGRRFLPHQLGRGVDFSSQQRIPVTISFQPQICRECRGLQAEPHPKAAIHGRTSKIKRYYWRELHKRETEIFAEWADSASLDPLLANRPDAKFAHEEAAKKALQEIKELHRTNPKYTYSADKTQAEVIDSCKVDILRLDGVYVRNDKIRAAQILYGDSIVSPEEFVSRHFQEQGYETLFVESVPFHVLYGVFMWLVIQDSTDERVRIVGFGNRNDFEEKQPSNEVLCHLPDDFGTSEYGIRRKTEIDRHFVEMLDPDELVWLFEYWLLYSEKLRQYLWAHREPDIQTAAKLLEILPKTTILKILRYLIDSYWERYLGWPDLLIFRDDEFCFVEVKSSKDKLSNEQKR
jgi:hypothetical protein